MFGLGIIGLFFAASAGAVRLSDGTVVSGRIEMPAVRLYPEGGKTLVRIAPEEIALLRVLVQKEEQRTGWVFVQEGSPEKLRLPAVWPFRQYRAEVFLRSGQVLRGRFLSLSFFVALKEEDRRFVLLSTQRGKPGQSPHDLLYVREIAFSDTLPPQAALGSLCGRIQGAREVILLRRGDPASLRVLCEKSGAFRAERLPGGSYQVFVVGDNAVGVPTLGESLTREERREAQRFCAGVRDFFPERRMMLSGKETRQERTVLRLLVGLRRLGGSTAGERAYLRLELWELDHRAGRLGLVERTFLFRRTGPARQKLHFPRVVPVPELRGVKVRTGSVALPPCPSLSQAFLRGT